MKKTALEIKGICIAGANVIINATDYSVLELKSIVIAAKIAGTRLCIKHSSKLTTLDCKGIANVGEKGTVTFDFVE